MSHGTFAPCPLPTESEDATPATVLIATGGTIACTRDENGCLVPTKTAADLAALLGLPVHAIDFRQLDSTAITLKDLDELIELVEDLSNQGSVERIIITHGTDSLEETALALALFHHSSTPVILTGAQRPFDDPAPDGPANLCAALEAIGTGVLVQFGGVTTPAWGTRKVHTTALQAFSAADANFPKVVPLPRARLADQHVTVCVAYPGAPRGGIDEAVRAGCEGIVVEGLGAGNVSPEMGEGITDAVARGVSVLMTTRVPGGAVDMVYGGPGGGKTLETAGVVGAGILRAGQARIVLAAALATGIDIRTFF